MAAQSWPALGTTVGVDESGSGTFTLIGQIKSIKGAGGGEVGERDTTTLSSSVKSSAPTIPDNGEFSFDFNADPTDSVHQFLQAEKDSPPAAGARDWQVTFSTTGSVTTKSFPGFVKTIDGINADGVDDSLTGSCTVKVNGAVVSASA